jgi:hypothetical protein
VQPQLERKPGRWQISGEREIIMLKLGRLACAIVLVVGLGSPSLAQQPSASVPDQAFKTVHLMAVEPAQEPALRTAVSAFNAELKRQGCTGCAYHLMRMFVGSQSPFNFMVSSDWPGRSEYVRVHDSAAFASAYARNPVFGQLEAKQFYGRFVDVK